MPYPSFLWSTPLTSDTEPEAVIPESVISDLTLGADFRAGSLLYLRIPCSADEIRMRQGIFRLALSDDQFLETLGSLGQEIGELTSIIGYYDRAEDKRLRLMYFLPVLGRYLRLVKSFALLAGYPGRIGVVGAYFKAIEESGKYAAALSDYQEISNKRSSDMLYTIGSGGAFAVEGGESLLDRFNRYFSEMSVGEAVSQKKYALRADLTEAAAYSKVYSGFYASVELLYLKYAGYIDGREDDADDLRLMSVYSREIDFIIDAAGYFRKLDAAEFSLSYPTVSEKREIVLNGLIDASLIKRELCGSDIVPNDLFMTEGSADGEKLSFYILTGANGGGKTTFARACGIALVFFLSGCPVTAESGRIYPFSAVFTHFPANESFENSGRFVNEANRAEEIIDAADNDSFVIFNETYSGTDEQKSEYYSKRLADMMYSRGVFGLFVTHIHSLTGGEIPVLSAVVDESDDNRRTYKIRRVGATSSSFAKDILEKYGLDKAGLEQRMKRSRDNVR